MKPSETSQSSVFIVACPHCGAKNRIDPGNVGTGARCGKCSQRIAAESDPQPPNGYLFRCPECGTRNRIAADKVNDGAKCGRCGTRLQTGGLFLPQPLTVTDANFESGVLKSPLPAVVFAWAPW